MKPCIIEQNGGWLETIYQCVKKIKRGFPDSPSIIILMSSWSPYGLPIILPGCLGAEKKIFICNQNTNELMKSRNEGAVWFCITTYV